MVGFPPALDKRVTPDNLFLYPFNRWTLQSTRRFTRTASTLIERKDVLPIPEKLDNALLNTNPTINGAVTPLRTTPAERSPMLWSCQRR